MLQKNILGKTSPPGDSQLCRFFADQLRCIYKAEQGLLGPVTIMQQSASMEDLKKLFAEYLLQLHKQAMRLEDIFSILLINPLAAEPCDAMEGLIKEIDRVIQKTAEGSITRDAALIIAVQKAEHYKIATYGSLEQLATSPGMEEVSNLLNQSLQDEKDHDLLFSDIAERRVNWLAETE
jgi:ferritin-like metal-binding protein YciE